MDMWLYYEVTHADHRFCNPISVEGLEELEGVLDLRPGMRVLDVACGHGEMLIRLAERFGIAGVGVDASPYAFARFEKNVAARVPDADLTVVHGKGEEYRSDEPFDVAMCIGASWIWKGFEGTLRALTDYVKPGGLIVSGEPWWMAPPSPEYCEIEELPAEDFFDLAGCLEIARGQGLELVWMRRSSDQEWDRYEMQQMAALDRWARANPDHPDLPEIRAKAYASKEAYVRWGAFQLGFAFWVFRTPA
jgi:SAM-dependent methyltransferase